MKESSYIDNNDVSKQEYSEGKVENGDSGLSKSIQFVVNEVSSLLNYSNASKTKEQDVSHLLREIGHLKVNATEIHKTIQISSTIKLRSNNPLLLSLTALLSNPHHAKYLNVMTENIIEGLLENQSKKNNIDELENKTNDFISKNSKNTIINLIASNLQYYLFEGRATNIVINDLVFTLMKAYSNERTPNKVFDMNNWETNNQVFIEAKDWCVLIGPKECIFPKTCYELRDLLNKKGIKLRSYFENVNNSENAMSKMNQGAAGFESQDTNISSIDDLDTQYFESLSYSKLREYKSNNIPNYSHFEQIKKFISVQYPNLKTFFYSPGSCIYINGNDVVTFLEILKSFTEGKNKQENESRHNLTTKKTSNLKNPYCFLKDTKRIISNFPIKDTIFKASTCDCNFIHNSTQNKAQGFYELNIEGLFLPNSLYVILNGFKLLCPDIYTCNVSIENFAEPPFFPNEVSKPVIIWEKLIPLLNSIIRSISPTLVELANQLKPYTKVYFKNSKASIENIKNNQEQTQMQTFNYAIPFFSLPRKRLNPISQLQNSQRSYTNVNCRNNSQNFVTIGTSVINNSALSQIQSRNIQPSNSTFSNILFDFSTSNGVFDGINAQAGPIFSNGMGNIPNLTGSSSSVENQALLALQQNNTHSHPPLLPSSGIRARTPNSTSANIQWLNFKGLGFSSQLNSNYVSLSTPMGKQLLHRIGTINPIQRLEQTQILISSQTKSNNTKGINSNQSQSPSESLTTKIFEETALCFIGFDSDRLDYFAARAVEEGAKVIKSTHFEREYIKQYSKHNVLKEMNNSSFVYSWLNVTRFYFVIDDSKFQSDEANYFEFNYERIYQYFEFQQFVSLEWFLTSCFERRSLDPDMFAPICRPVFPIQRSDQTHAELSAEDDLLVIIIENFPHMNKIYNSSKEGQESLSSAIWSNCIQRILRSIYGPNIINIREIAGIIEKNKSKWERDFPSNLIVVPCNLIPYKSNLNIVDFESTNLPISALYGPNKRQFITDLDNIKNCFSCFKSKKDRNFEEILRIVTPSWLLDSCSKRVRLDYQEYEISHSTSIVQIQRRRRAKAITIDGKNNHYKEEVCFFYKKDINSNIFNFIPSQGPWPLWGWNIYIIDSIKQRLSENLRKKLREVGATFIESIKSFENVITYSQDQIEDLLNEVRRNYVNLIVCSDFLDSQLIKKIGLNNYRKDELNYQVLKGINIVGESWVNMVHGTRTLHPFECKFYFDHPNLNYKNLDHEYKDFNSNKILEDYSHSKKIEQNKKCNDNKGKLDESSHSKNNHVSCENRGNSIISQDSKYTKENNVKKIKRENKITKVHFGELGSVGSVIEENVQSSNSSENSELNKQKRKRTMNKDLHIMDNSTNFGSFKKKAIENNSAYYDPNLNKDHLSALDKGNQNENEFLVPLSLSFMSGWGEDKNKDFIPLFSSHTPIRKGCELREIHSSTPTGSQSNWMDRYNNVEDLIDYIYQNESNDDFGSQTDKTTTFQKTLDESENDRHVNTAIDNYSPILCPVIPINLNY